MLDGKAGAGGGGDPEVGAGGDHARAHQHGHPCVRNGPAKEPLPAGWKSPAHPCAGSHTSIVTSSGTGRIVATTRQNAGRFSIGFAFCVGGVNVPPVTICADTIVVSGSEAEASIVHASAPPEDAAFPSSPFCAAHAASSSDDTAHRISGATHHGSFQLGGSTISQGVGRHFEASASRLKEELVTNGSARYFGSSTTVVTVNHSKPAPPWRSKYSVTTAFSL